MSTTALAVTMAWPRPVVLLEADAAGGDLAFWARRPDGAPPAVGDGGDGGLLAPEPSLLTLAADARSGLPVALPRYAQASRWGIDVIVAPPAAQAFWPLRPLWDGVAEQAAAWPGTVVVDLGRFHGGAAAAPVARAATAVLVVTRASVAGLYHVRERVHELVHTLGEASRPRSPLGVVVRTARRDAGAVEAQIAAMLEAAGVPVPVIGSIWDDEASAARLQAGQVGGRGRRAGDLAASAARLVSAIGRRWPEMAAAAGVPVAAGSQ
ncbi:MAG: hypothetical protein JNL54_04290 [Kineosporiaceae bacterium]|nr:hypothetical protein [Kineosporiaceae bacterium]